MRNVCLLWFFHWAVTKDEAFIRERRKKGEMEYAEKKGASMRSSWLGLASFVATVFDQCWLSGFCFVFVLVVRILCLVSEFVRVRIR